MHHRWWQLVALSTLFVATTGRTAEPSRPVFLDDGTWEQAIRDRGVDPSFLENPLATTDAMKDAARDYARGGREIERLNLLQRALFDPKLFTFEYESHRTLTAREAFETRRGNCVSFVNLFIALARSLDIAVRPAVLKMVEDVEMEGDLVVVNTHLVAAYERPKKAMVFDFYRTRRDVPIAVRLLDDLDLGAIYLNNLGVERLRDDDLAASLDYFSAAIALSPEFAEAYANLGVARRRTGDVQGALDAYFDGLGVAPDHKRILYNLASLYRAEAIAAGDEAPRAEGDSAVTPTEVIKRADRDLAGGDLKRAMQLYARAHRMDGKLAEPLVGMARLELVRGRPRAARKHLENALEVDPGNVGARDLLEYLDRAYGE